MGVITSLGRTASRDAGMGKLGRLAVSAAASVLIMSGCGQTDAPRSDPVMPPAGIAEEWLPRGINDIVWSSAIGLVGTVESSERVDVPHPYIDYADISLTVETVLFTNESWARPIPMSGETIEFAESLPSGDPSDSVVGGLPPDVPVGNRYGPHLASGDRVVVMLQMTPIDVGAGRTIQALRPSHGYQSLWTISTDGAAVSVQPARTVGLDALLARVQEERNRGRIDPAIDPAAAAEDATTVYNPLGGEPLPTPVPPVTTEPTQTTLPQIVPSPNTVTLKVAATGATAEATFGETAAGGVIITLTADGVSLGGSGGPTAASQEASPVVQYLPSGEAIVAAVGSAGSRAADVRVLVDGERVSAETATWNREGSRPVVAFIVPTPPATLEITGLLPSSAVTLQVPSAQPAAPPTEAPPTPIEGSTTSAPPATTG